MTRPKTQEEIEARTHRPKDVPAGPSAFESTPWAMFKKDAPRLAEESARAVGRGLIMGAPYGSGPKTVAALETLGDRSYEDALAEEQARIAETEAESPLLTTLASMIPGYGIGKAIGAAGNVLSKVVPATSKAAQYAARVAPAGAYVGSELASQGASPTASLLATGATLAAPAAASRFQRLAGYFAPSAEARFLEKALKAPVSAAVANAPDLAMATAGIPNPEQDLDAWLKWVASLPQPRQVGPDVPKPVLEPSAQRRGMSKSRLRDLVDVEYPSKDVVAYKLAGKPVGEIALTSGQKPKVSSTEAIPPEFRGLGLGKKMYGELIRRMPGTTLESDVSVSDAAQRVWKGMKRRPGYVVEERVNPLDVFPPSPERLSGEDLISARLKEQPLVPFRASLPEQAFVPSPLAERTALPRATEMTEYEKELVRLAEINDRNRRMEEAAQNTAMRSEEETQRLARKDALQKAFARMRASRKPE